jgi:peptidoglycan/LPS O-acetylase OafA/YrhL
MVGLSMDTPKKLVPTGLETHSERVARARPRLAPPRNSGHGGLPAAAPQPQQRMEALDGLRALSIMVVLVGHGATSTGAPALLWPVRDLGRLGVYLFFAISGFIITLLMARERRRSGTLDLHAFWLRRALRILPPFAAACGGIALAAGLGLLQWHWPSFLGALTFTKNTLLFRGDWFFGHFWSLSLEEQFYIVWPLLFLALIRKHHALLVLAGLTLASPLLMLLSQATYPLLDNTLPCLPYLALGCLLALLLHERHPALQWWRMRKRLRRAALWTLPPCAVGAALLVRDGHWFYADAIVHACVVPVAVAVLLSEGVLEDGLLRRSMAWAPLRGIGMISYSLYLWQQLFLAKPEDYLKPDAFWVQWPQNLLAAVACGTLAYLLVERPAAALKRRLDVRAKALHGSGHKKGGLRTFVPVVRQPASMLLLTPPLKSASRSART